MKLSKTYRSVFCIISIIFMAISFMACGGSGGGSSSSTTSGTGSVALMIADGPLDDLATLTITITKVSLLPPGNGKGVVIYDSPSGHPVDILEYRNQDLLFTLNKEVPAGRYEKIRLEVSDVAATAKANTPGTCADLEIKLPSGKIDLNPQGGFVVSDGQTLAIRLDIDARKSIELHPAGNSGKCIFRPVIFVDITPVDLIERCPAVFKGEVKAFLYNAQGLRNGLVLDLPGNRGDLNVLVGSQTVIFGENGTIANINDLQVRDIVYVRGPLTSTGELTASLIVVGEVLKLEGTVASFNANADSKQFELNLDEGQAFTDPTVNVDLLAGTLILSGCESQVDDSYLQVGSQVTAIGKYSQAASALQAVAVIIKSHEITGTLVSITQVSGQGYNLGINTVSGTTKTVLLPQGEAVFLEGDGEVDFTQLTALVTCGKYPTVRVILDPSIASPLTAQNVYVVAEQLQGTVTSVDGSTGELTLYSGAVRTVIKVELGATIMKDSAPLSFSDISVNDTITAFGLSACSSDAVNFFGYIIVVETNP